MRYRIDRWLDQLKQRSEGRYLLGDEAYLNVSVFGDLGGERVRAEAVIDKGCGLIVASLHTDGILPMEVGLFQPGACQTPAEALDVHRVHSRVIELGELFNRLHPQLKYPEKTES